MAQRVQEVIDIAKVLLLCTTCEIIFFRGKVKKNVFDNIQRPFVDYVLLSRGHAWDEPYHTIREFIYGEYLPLNESVSYVANEKKKQHTHIANRQFWPVWKTRDQLVKCSVCYSEYSSIREACFCCQSEKVTFYFPYEHLDVLLSE